MYKFYKFIIFLNLINQRKLFFIIGIGRSCTTLLQEIMNTFNGFCNLKESVIGEFPQGISLWSYVRKSNDFSPLESFIQNNWTKEFFEIKKIDYLEGLNCIFFKGLNYGIKCTFKVIWTHKKNNRNKRPCSFY